MSFQRTSRFSSLSVALLFAICLANTGRSASQAGFTSIDFPGASHTEALGINSRGDIVGHYYNATGEHGFLLNQGAFITIDVPGASYTCATGINAGGDIVGYYFDPSAPPVDPFGTRATNGFLLRKGVFTTIRFPDNPADDHGYIYGTWPRGINQQGEIVGHDQTYLPTNAFVLSKSTFANIGLPSSYKSANGINSQGDIVGEYGDAPPHHSFLLSKGKLSDIILPGAFSTFANGINEQGEIVGLYGVYLTGTHGFLLSKGVVTNIDFPDASGTVVFGINQQGEMVGSYIGPDKTTHGFLLHR